MGLVVEAPSWPALCEEAARAFGAFVGGGAADEGSAVEGAAVTLRGLDRDELWVRWWRALLQLWLVEARLPVSAAVEPASGELELRARPSVVARETLDPAGCVDVKAVTWHRAHVTCEGDRWRGRIVLDV